LIPPAPAEAPAVGGVGGRDRSRSPPNVLNDGNLGRGSAGKSSCASREWFWRFARCPLEPAPDLEAMERALCRGLCAGNFRRCVAWAWPGMVGRNVDSCEGWADGWWCSYLTSEHLSRDDDVEAS
jgi:hypothetical protein